MVKPENQQEVSGVPATVDSNGSFTLNFCVPNVAPGIYPTFFTISSLPGMYSGPIFTITAGTAGNCQSTAKCPDAYFIGLHGWGEGPDSQHPELQDSKSVQMTLNSFRKMVESKKDIKEYYINFPSPGFLAEGDDAITFMYNTIGGVNIGVDNLNKYVRGTVLEETLLEVCRDPKIVLVGYSIGAVVINEWLNKNKDLWQYIKAVELYGDILWRRYGPPFPDGAKDTYEGVLRRLGIIEIMRLSGLISSENDPYAKNFPEVQGPRRRAVWPVAESVSAR
jgi:hypothetical protein